MKVPIAGVAIDACFHLGLSKNFPQAHDISGEKARMNGCILNEGQRSLRSFCLIENGAGDASDLFKHGRLFFIPGHLYRCGQFFLLDEKPLGFDELMRRPFSILFLEFNKEEGLGPLRKIRPHLCLLFSGKVDDLPFNNLKHGRRELKEFLCGRAHMIQIVKIDEASPCPSREGGETELCASDDSQSSLSSHEKGGKVSESAPLQSPE